MLSNATIISRFFARTTKKVKLLEGAFSFKDKKEIDNILSKYPSDKKQSAILPLLHLGQKENGFINTGVVNEVSKIVGSKPGKVHETASFYSMFRFEPPNKHIIEVCKGVPCYLRGSENIKKVIEHETGGTFASGKSNDGLFTLEEVECLGACANAPVMVVDGVYYQNLTGDTVKKIVAGLKDGSDISKYDAKHTPPPKPL